MSLLTCHSPSFVNTCRTESAQPLINVCSHTSTRHNRTRHSDKLKQLALTHISRFAFVCYLSSQIWGVLTLTITWHWCATVLQVWKTFTHVENDLNKNIFPLLCFFQSNIFPWILSWISAFHLHFANCIRNLKNKNNIIL